jgi:hypothetical protein
MEKAVAMSHLADMMLLNTRRITIRIFILVFFLNIYIYLYLKFNEKCECGARFLNKKNLTRHQNESCISRPTESTGLGGHISTLVSGLPVASTQGCFFVD